MHDVQRAAAPQSGTSTMEIPKLCGRCRKEITASYFDTFHGKVSTLGYLKTAKCCDCHGAHDIVPVAEASSHLSRHDMVATGTKCCSGSNRSFAG